MEIINLNLINQSINTTELLRKIALFVPSLQYQCPSCMVRHAIQCGMMQDNTLTYTKLITDGLIYHTDNYSCFQKENILNDLGHWLWHCSVDRVPLSTSVPSSIRPCLGLPKCSKVLTENWYHLHHICVRYCYQVVEFCLMSGMKNQEGSKKFKQYVSQFHTVPWVW